MCLVLNVFFVYADSSISEDKEKLKDVNDQIEQNKKKQRQLDQQVKNVSAEINRLDTQIDEVEKNLNEVENQLANLNIQITTTKEELNQAQQNIETKNDTFNSRLRAMYKNNTLGYLEIIFAAEDLRDLLTRLDMVKKIIDHDVELLKYMKEQKKIIQEKKLDLEEKHAETQVMKKKISIKKEELEIATRSKQHLMSSLEQDKKEALRQLDKLNELSKEIEESIKKKQLAMEYAGGEMSWPAPGYYHISSPYGWRLHPIWKVRKMHTGMDVRTPSGANIVAANSGEVQHSGRLGGYGNVVIIDHGGKITTLYAHNSRLLVKEGQWVERGQIIAKAGSTGYSTGPHLHFEVRKNGKHVNPYPWVKNK